MIRTTLLLVCMCGMLGSQPTLEPPEAELNPMVFDTLDLVLDTGDEALAAYQLECHDASGAARIVGIEGGDHEAFRQPPFYDPKAIQHDRVILATFSTAETDALPRSSTRIATLHVQRPANVKPDYHVRLITAGNAAGQMIDAKVTWR